MFEGTNIGSKGEISMTNRADERLDEIIKHLTWKPESMWITESIRILESLKSENRGKWVKLHHSDNRMSDYELDAMILNEGE